MLKSKKMMIVIFAVVIIAIVGMIGLEVYAADNPIDLDITGINQQSDANQIIANQIIANQIAANQGERQIQQLFNQQQIQVQVQTVKHFQKLV